MTIAEVFDTEHAGQNVLPGTEIARKPAPEVFNTTDVFFENMKVRQFAPSEHTPAISPFVFDAKILTRLVMWAATAGLPPGMFGAEIKKNLWIYGPTGCGKSRLVDAFSARTGRSVFTLNCHEDVRPSTLFGSWKFCGNGSSSVPTMTWINGKILQWAKTPNSVLVLDEADQLEPEVFMSLNGVLDGVPFVVDETGERITVAPGCLVVATANTNGRGSAGGNGGSAALYKGAKKQNVATMDRFNVIETTYLTVPEEIHLLMSQARVTEVTAQAMAGLASKIRAMFLGLYEDAGSNGMALQFTITTRNLLNWGMNYMLLTQMGKESTEALPLALSYTLLDLAPKAERDAVLDVLKNKVIGGKA